MDSSESELYQRVLHGDALLGYVFYTDEVFPIPAYSGKPIRALVGVDTANTIMGIIIVSHDEPILVIGVSDQDINHYIDQYAGLPVSEKIKLGRQKRDGYSNIDGISGATITAMVLHRSIMESARRVVAVSRTGAEPLPIQPEIWVLNWEDNLWKLIILGLGIGMLTVALFVQDWLVSRTQLFKWFRLGFLVYTLVFIGFICMAQLSIVNILTFFGVITKGFRWDTFLVDPGIFVLWAFVAVSILLWGRGVFCGWLCPFGALQELTGKLAGKLKIKQYPFPPMIHERLWAIKYLVLMALIGLSLDSMTRAAPFIDIEPFKTVFNLRFQREWWFVAFAVALILISAVNVKFYCKYICPLGAALSIGTRFRIFDWLRRRRECGASCHACANECDVGAIKSTGEIIETECHYCLECQATYWDEHKCPPMVSKRERRERREARVQLVPTKTL